MKNEITMMYPEIIIYSLIISGVILLFWRKKKRFKRGIIVANTKYVKKTSYFKILNAKYHLYNILIKVACIIVIFVYAVLSARIYEVKKHDEEYNNRDIMLCMDFSGSVNNLNKELIQTMKETVNSLKDERFGITIFDNTSITLVPLTTDYNYVMYTLDLMSKYFDINQVIRGVNMSECVNVGPYGYNGLDQECVQRVINNRYTAQEKYIKSIFESGLRTFKGSSLIGDGLASCASSFKNDDRTKIIILTTDNMVAGTQIITLDNAAAYAKERNIKVYPIGTKSIKNKDKYRQGLVDLANKTDGVYYDYEDYSTDEINKKIEELNKSAIIKTAYVTKKDLPETVFPLLLFLIPILFILDWRVRI